LCTTRLLSLSSKFSPPPADKAVAQFETSPAP
jgi:hypothetical protein